MKDARNNLRSHDFSKLSPRPIEPGENRLSSRLATTNRREFIRSISCAGAAVGLGGHRAFAGRAAETSRVRNQALVAITLDLEMARNFPRWEDTHWDYEKGNLNDSAKKYALEAAQRVKSHGGVIHFFAVGQVFD